MDHEELDADDLGSSADVPPPFGFFSAEVLDLFRPQNKEVLAAIVRLFLPEYEADCDALTLTQCDPSDEDKLYHLVKHQLVAIPKMVLSDIDDDDCDVDQLLGSFCVAIPIFNVIGPSFLSRGRWSHTVEVKVDCWTLSVRLTVSSRRSHTSTTVPASFVPSERHPRRSKFTLGDFVMNATISASLHGEAARQSQLPLLGVRFRLKSEDLLPLRNAFFGEERKAVKANAYTPCGVSEFVPKAQYDDTMNRLQGQSGSLHALAAHTYGGGPLTCYGGSVCIDDLEALQSVARASDLSDRFGAECCSACWWLHFELHALKPTFVPPLAPFDFSGLDGGKLTGRAAEFAWLDIAA